MANDLVGLRVEGRSVPDLLLLASDGATEGTADVPAKTQTQMEEDVLTMTINPGFNEKILEPRKTTQEFRRYRMRFEKNPVYDIVDWIPVHLDLELTARCQLKCPGCPSMKLKYGRGDMDVNTAKLAICEFATKGGASIKFNWRGEPTLYPRLADLVKHATDFSVIDKMINTNGVKMTQSLSKDLIKAGLTSCAWSIDSHIDATYEKLRPGAKLPLVLENLSTFLDYKDLLDSDVYVRVQRIGYPKVIKEEPFDEFVDFFKDHYPGINAIAENHYKEKALEGRTDIPSQPCAQPWQRLVMAYDGTVGPCCEMNRFKSPLGVYPKENLPNIWRSDSLEFLRQCHREGRQNELEACKRCTVTKVV